MGEAKRSKQSWGRRNSTSFSPDKVAAGMMLLSPCSCHDVGEAGFDARLELFCALVEAPSSGPSLALVSLRKPGDMGSSSAGTAVSSGARGSRSSEGATLGNSSGKTQSVIGLLTAAAPMPLSPLRHSVKASVTASEPPMSWPHTPMRATIGRENPSWSRFSFSHSWPKSTSCTGVGNW